MKYPLVSVIVPNWNSGDKIIACLDSIFEMDYSSLEVIVIDNGSDDGSKQEIQKKFGKKVTIIENPENYGCVKAVNQGFESAKGDYILRLDSDVILAKNLLKVLVETMLKDNEIGIVFPKIYYYNEKNKFDNLGFSISLFTGKAKSERIDKLDEGQFEEEVSVDLVPGSVLLTKKEVIKKAGLINTDYFLFYEDAEWCLNVRRAGYKIIYTPKTKAWHNCNKKEINPFKMRHFMRSKLIFIRRNASFGNKIVFYPFFFILYFPSRLVLFLLKRNFFLIKPFLAGTKEGLFYKVSK